MTHAAEEADELTSVLRRVGALLVPDPVDAERLPLVRRPRAGGAHDAGILVGAAARRARSPHRESFLSAPRNRSPRALLPNPITAPSRDLLRPRAAASGWRRGAHTLLAATPRPLLAAASLPVTFALPAESALMAAVRSRFESCSIGFYLGNRFNYRRPAMFVFGGAGLQAVCKFVSDDHGKARLRVERDVIAALSADRLYDGRIPQPIIDMSTHGGDALVVSALPGHPTPVDMSAPVRRWLDLCVGERRVRFRDFEHVRGQLARREGESAIAREAVRRAAPAIAELEVPATVVHGDFAPWNTLIEDDVLRVFDWEYGVLDGVPGWDAAFWQIQVGLVLHDWDPAAVVAHVTRLEPLPSYSALQHRALLAFLLAHMIDRSRPIDDAARTAVLEGSLERLLEGGWLEATP